MTVGGEPATSSTDAIFGMKKTSPAKDVKDTNPAIAQLLKDSKPPVQKSSSVITIEKPKKKKNKKRRKNSDSD